MRCRRPNHYWIIPPYCRHHCQSVLMAAPWVATALNLFRYRSIEVAQIRSSSLTAAMAALPGVRLRRSRPPTGLRQMDSPVRSRSRRWPRRLLPEALGWEVETRAHCLNSRLLARLPFVGFYILLARGPTGG